MYLKQFLLLILVLYRRNYDKSALLSGISGAKKIQWIYYIVNVFWMQILYWKRENSVPLHLLSEHHHGNWTLSEA